MGIFDGQIKNFAVKFTDYLDERVAHYFAAGNGEETSKELKSVYFTVAMTLQEVSNALKHVAGL